MRHIRRRAAGERGAILVLSTVGVVVAVIAAALAVDLGRLASDKRDDQKVADLAALDASRDLSQACARAKASASANGFPNLDCTDPANNSTEDVVIGRMSVGGFAPDPGGDAVQVKVASPFKPAFPFVTGPSAVSVKGVAGVRNPASFSLGSGVASIDTNRSTLLNKVVGQMLCSAVCATGDAELSLVNWQGLVTARLSLQALQTSLANAGFSVGTVSQLLSANMTLSQLYAATASALTTGGDTADANIFNVLTVKATSTAQITLGKMIHVQQGAENAALGTSIGLLPLVTGSAEVANGNHTIDVPDAGVTVSGVTSTRLRMTVIEPPVIFVGYFGDAGVSTAQVNLTVTPTLNLAIPLVATVTGNLPIVLNGGSATAALAAAPSCPSAGYKSFQVAVATKAGGVTQDSTLNVTVLGLPGGPGLLTTTGDVSVAANSGTSPAFTEQATNPQSFVPSTWHFGGTSLGLGAALTGSGSNSLVNGVLVTLLSSLRTVVDTVDSSIVQPLMQELGLDLGNADVAPLSVACGQPSLLG